MRAWGCPMVDDPAIIYVGSVVRDAPAFWGPAFSPAGNLFQLSLLNGLQAVDAPLVAVLTQRPQRAFPNGPLRWFRGEDVELDGGLRARLLPFLNVPVLRPITVGLAVIGSAWRIARRSGSRRLVICTHNLSEPPGLFTLLAARLLGGRAVAYVCDVHVPGRLVAASWSRRLDFALQRWLLPRYDGLIVVNENTATDLAPRVPHIRVEGGVTAPMLSVADRRMDSRRSDAGLFTMVAAGSLHPGNGISEILGAMRLLHDPSYRLRIAGRGPLEPLVREAQARDPRIQYCGLLTFDQVLDLYASADVLLNVRLTREIDTRYYFPSKVMEYLASGVPVITTCPGNVREEFADIAFLLEDETADSLAQLIASVAALPREERDARGRAARDFMAAEKTWAIQARRIVQFLEGLAT